MTNAHEIIDLEFATAQLSGNTDLLYRMLGKFKNEFIDVPNDVAALLAEGKLKDAKLKVHTTKGISGNLGLMALFECSKALDLQLRENTFEQSQVERFAQLMQTTCEYIESANFESSKMAPSKNRAPANDLKSVFLERLKRQEFIDDDTLEEYVEGLQLNQQLKQEITSLIEDLQYAKAIELITSAD